MAPLPGPDRPPRIKAKGLPRIIRNPGAKSIPALKRKGYKLAGPKAGKRVYVRSVAKPPKPRTTPSPGLRAPTAPPDPYAAYANYPSFRRQLEQVDRDQAHHELYLSDKVQPWVGQALTNLTGVDPTKPGINPTLQQQYLANIQGVVGGALGAAATATPMMPGATTPGGIVASPTAYLSQAAREGAAGQAAGHLQSAQSSAALQTLQPNLYSQGVVRQIADIAAGLPGLYAQRRNDMRNKFDEFILQFEEENRRARVNEGISAMNAQANIAISLGQLGLDAQDVQRRLSEANAEQTQAAAEASAPAPYGYFRDVDGSLVRDPSVPTATQGGGGGSKGTSTRDAKGRPKVPVLQEKGYVGGWVKRPKSVPTGARVVQAANNRWYMLRPGTSGSGAKPKAGSKPFDVQKDLIYSVNNGFIDDADQNVATGDLLRFLRKHQPQKPAAFVGWWKQVLPVLARQDPNFAEWMAGYILRRQRDGSWKGRL